LSVKPGRILLLSAYDAASHRYWHQLLRDELSDWDWQVLTLPARHFSWRIRGNPLYWAQACRELLEQPYDLVLATSMVDLSTLRGLVPALARIPTLLYFHENQFEYPPGRGRHGPLEAQMVSLYAALAADLLVFNSHYNLDTFMAGCESLLGRLPDAVPAGVVAGLQAKAQVLPVPLLDQQTGPELRPSGDLQLVWNHRWEYDKGPAELLSLAEELLAQGIIFKLHVVGQQFREQPREFQALRELLQSKGALGEWGYVAQASDYHALLRACDVVLSTALHDFQGLAVLEACAAGCTPLVPDRLVYGEWFEAEFCYRDQQQAVRRIAQFANLKATGGQLPRVDVSAFSASCLIPRYRGLLRSQLGAKSVS
jgi:glycosyltransferase involved in cell wall biosynthesis